MYVPVLYVDDPAVELLNNEDSCARAQLTNNGTCNVDKEDSKSITRKAESHRLINNRYSALAEIDTEAT